MQALCIDDEPLVLSALKRAVEQSPDIHSVAAFDDEIDAIEWAQSHTVDVAFLDIELHEMNGLEVARRLLQFHPETAIVFCTGYEQYAVEALNMHIDAGYLVKPVRASRVQEEIDHIRKRKTEQYRIRAVCFGNFEVYADGVPLEFKRKKAKELLAYLIDRHGVEVTTNELCAVLWENPGNDGKYRDYVYHLIADLKKTLAKADADDVLLILNRGYAVNTKFIDCDYYRLIEHRSTETVHFLGEYMHQYTWGEARAAAFAEFINGP